MGGGPELGILKFGFNGKTCVGYGANGDCDSGGYGAGGGIEFTIELKRTINQPSIKQGTLHTSYTYIDAEPLE